MVQPRQRGWQRRFVCWGRPVRTVHGHCEESSVPVLRGRHTIFVHRPVTVCEGVLTAAETGMKGRLCCSDA
jgi:hypothetical protein